MIKYTAFLWQRCRICGRDFCPQIHNIFCPHNPKRANATMTDEKEYKDYLEGKRECL